MKFKELELSPELLKSVERAGFEEATPIQAETIPLALAGKDVIGQAQTGTGKTAAFGLPMLEKIDPDRHELQGLVIAPTRELAIQTQEELYRLGATKSACASRLRWSRYWPSDPWLERSSTYRCGYTRTYA